jgi:class 3 adenylate cyclase
VYPTTVDLHFLTASFLHTFNDFQEFLKVETIGDCYVAVCGLPESSKCHALEIAKFASSCLDEMTVITQRLELSLGPGTTDLALRLGLHSGPTVAGVLRGEKARFQLFGDTVRGVTSLC